MRLIKQLLCISLVVVIMVSSMSIISSATNDKELPFEDVPTASWYYNAVKWCYENRLMAGTSASRFSPNKPLTRAQAVVILSAFLRGDTSNKAGSNFTDVEANKWYTGAVNYANSTGLMVGSNGRFLPNDTLTREQFCVVLYKLAKDYSISLDSKADLSKYTDASSISNYAKDAVSWAVANGLISGTSATTISPKSAITRAQISVILKNFYTETIVDSLAIVSFKVNGTEENSYTKLVKVGDQIGTLPFPKSDGYKFTGWRNSADERVTNTYTLEEGGWQTLTASFEKSTDVKITFTVNNKDCTCPETSRYVTPGEAIGELPDVVCPQGVNFNGWTLSDGTIVDENYIVTQDYDFSLYAEIQDSRVIFC